MADADRTIDIAGSSELEAAVAEVARTGQRQEYRIDGEDVVLIVKPKTRRRSRSKIRPVDHDDPLFKLVGIGGGGGPSNASEQKHEALEEIHRSFHSS